MGVLGETDVCHLLPYLTLPLNMPGKRDAREDRCVAQGTGLISIPSPLLQDCILGIDFVIFVL